VNGAGLDRALAVGHVVDAASITSPTWSCDMGTPARNTICLWYNRDAEDAARLYADTVPDSSVDAVHRAPGDFPSGQQGDVLTVEFTVATAVRRAPAAGAGTDGGCPGRSRRSPCLTIHK
jgi:hypothetical protein